MLNKITTILECSRVFSLPMTIMSWLVIYVFGIIDSGNIYYGILALIGICLVHLGTNILDDYFDYKFLIKQVDFNKKNYLANTQKTKCRYIISGLMSAKQVLLVGIFYFTTAIFIGLYFYIICGKPVIYFGLAGGIIALVYSFVSRIRLSELAVGLAYGPALFGGVYYVMTRTLSWEIFIISIPTTIMTIVLLYIHTVMDYEYDLKEEHLTISNFFNSQLDSLIILKILLVLAYISPMILCILDISDWQVLLCWITIPLAIDLYNSMIDYATDPKSIPNKKWFHFPMENMNRIKKIGAESFMTRMYQSRNLMIYFSIFLTIGIILASL